MTMELGNQKEINRLNNNKSGIYRITQIDIKASYIGSASNLTRRFRDYFSILQKEILRNKSMISRALLKYGHSKFTLEILEYCEPTELIKNNIISIIINLSIIFVRSQDLV